MANRRACLSDKFPPLAALKRTSAGILSMALSPGLVTISQQSLNTGGGFIHHIDTATGMMWGESDSSGLRRQRYAHSPE